MAVAEVIRDALDTEAVELLKSDPEAFFADRRRKSFDELIRLTEELGLYDDRD